MRRNVKFEEVENGEITITEEENTYTARIGIDKNPTKEGYENGYMYYILINNITRHFVYSNDERNFIVVIEGWIEDGERDGYLVLI